MCIHDIIIIKFFIIIIIESMAQSHFTPCYFTLLNGPWKQYFPMEHFQQGII